MTDSQKQFIDISKRYEALKKQMKELKPQLTELMKELAVGSNFQDPETLAVYQIVEPTGTYISFDTIGYERTKLESEVKGTLSMKKAEALGYSLKK